VALAPSLRHRPVAADDLTAAEFVEAVLAAARAGVEPEESVQADGTRSCRFLCTTPAAMVPSKLAEVARRFGLSVDAPEEGLVVLVRPVSGPRRTVEGELWVAVRRAEAGPETAAAAGVQGDLGDAARRDVLRAVPGVLAAVRGALESFRDRRAHPRYPVGFPVRIHPLGPDGVAGAAADGVCEDVSAGGARVLTRAAVPRGRVYLEFVTVEGVAGYALLAPVVRSARDPEGNRFACRFGG
jgi:hypothetical protein